jgi:hypothetical protein
MSISSAANADCENIPRGRGSSIGNEAKRSQAEGTAGESAAKWLDAQLLEGCYNAIKVDLGAGGAEAQRSPVKTVQATLTL